jgi:hypothetical protein
LEEKERNPSTYASKEEAPYIYTKEQEEQTPFEKKDFSKVLVKIPKEKYPMIFLEINMNKMKRKAEEKD